VTGSTSLASITSLQLTADSSSIPNVATKVGPDGAFEFPMVLPGAYTVRISPTLPVAALVVGSKDLRDVEIAIPPFKTVSGRVKVEGTVAAAPRLTFSLPGSLTTPNTTWAINQADGSFKVSLPLGEFPIQVEAAGFTVKALALGNVDGLQHPVLITTADSAEFKVTLTPLPGVSAPMPLAPFASLIPGEDPFAPSTAPISGGVRIDTVSGERTTFGSLSSFDPPRALQTDKALRLLTDALAPRVIRRVEPEYPEVARVARIEGEVSMRVSIADDGTPRDIIVESGHPSLREAAVKAVRQWLFEPDDAFALRTATIIVDFRLPPTPNP
jgi:TonB family protein